MKSCDIALSSVVMKRSLLGKSLKFGQTKAYRLQDTFDLSTVAISLLLLSMDFLRLGGTAAGGWLAGGWLAGVARSTHFRPWASMLPSLAS